MVYIVDVEDEPFCDACGRKKDDVKAILALSENKDTRNAIRICFCHKCRMELLGKLIDIE